MLCLPKRLRGEDLKFMSTTQKPYHFLIRRVHSLLGLIPVGLFLTFHICLNLTALGGSGLYDKVIGTMQSFPGIFIVELVVIFIPIALHAIYGTWVVYTCLLYTSDAADEEDSVDLGGRRIIKKKKNQTQ